MTSSDFLEMHHAMGVGVGGHSSQIYDFLKFRRQICAIACETTSIITLGKIVQIWTQGGGGVFGNKRGGRRIRHIAFKLFKLSSVKELQARCAYNSYTEIKSHTEVKLNMYYF